MYPTANADQKIYDPSNNRFAIFPDLFLFQVLQQSFATNFYVLCAKNHNGINAATNLFINFSHFPTEVLSCKNLFVMVDTICMMAISGNYRSNTFYLTRKPK